MSSGRDRPWKTIGSDSRTAHAPPGITEEKEMKPNNSKKKPGKTIFTLLLLTALLFLIIGLLVGIPQLL